ncbi:endonuclease III domain-containing protein [Latilactobacillus fuchuensis]|uniref:Endonuclease III n=1 Tax=Latilactobacillus fuchuensis DSM 14340 = JCM 11249 TaxID=1423747 RepID=A0A0R1RWC8_9LACO|nr:hypothetical protein [Latilactobacillus fuchuensis]KRL61388.1 endonuclease III [Latilactobacillus fuchuensis DSM 14340 = JCM 11249]
MIDYTALYHQLLAQHGPQHWWPADSVWEMMIGAILVQNTNWRNVDYSLANLKRATDLQPARILALSADQLMTLIRPSGFYRHKSQALVALLNFFKTHDYQISQMDATYSTLELRTLLLALPGVGPETADVLLLYVFNRPVFVADTYARRLVSHYEQRPLKNLTYAGVKKQLEATLTTLTVQDFQEFHALIDEFGSELRETNQKGS